jgi:hypothetical protein
LLQGNWRVAESWHNFLVESEIHSGFWAGEYNAEKVVLWLCL